MSYQRDFDRVLSIGVVGIGSQARSLRENGSHLHEVRTCPMPLS